MITSTSNQQIKNIVKLQKSSKTRKEQGVFLVEGIRMAREVPKEQLVKFYVTENWIGELQNSMGFTEGEEYEVVSESVYKEISDTQTPQGIMAVVKQKRYTREQLLRKKQSNCILLLENLQDPGNLGTIIRTAEGAGVSGIMMSHDTVDIYNSKVVRATMGAIFRVPFLYESSITEGVEWLKSQQVTCYAAHLSGQDFYEKNYLGNCCFFIGNEGNGLSDQLSDMADEKIKIPMEGQVESLNAATAATVLMYEAMRQRYTS